MAQACLIVRDKHSYAFHIDTRNDCNLGNVYMVLLSNYLGI